MNAIVDSLRPKLIEEYWLTKLTKDDIVASASIVSADRQTVRVSVEACWLEKIQQLTKENPLAEYTVYLAIYTVLLRNYFGEAVSVVTSPGLKTLTTDDVTHGLLFYKLDFSPENTVKDIVKLAQQEVQTNSQYQSYAYDSLTTALADKGLMANDLLQFGFYYNAANLTSDRLNGSTFQLLLNKHEGAYLEITLRFDDARYSELLVQQFLRHFVHLIREVRANLDQPVHRLDFLSDSEKQQVCHEFNALPGSVPTQTIAALFEEQVANFPDRVALVYGSKQWTYGELNRQANQIAHYLRDEWQIGPESLVGVMVDRSEWIVISILGILKAGAAFVPIDPQNPAERIQYIVSDSKLDGLLLQSDHLFSVADYEGPLFAVDIQTDELATPSGNPASGSSASSLAYVIYTSGTTGKPKGVMVENGSVVNYAQWLGQTFGLNETDRSILLASYAFDLGYTSIWGTLLRGGTLHLPPMDYVQNPGLLLSYIADQQISFIKTTPSLFSILTSIPEFETVSLAARLVLLGGEAFRADDALRFMARYPTTAIVNHYGPTEATIGTIAGLVDPLQIDRYRQQGLIGKPITNNEVLLLNSAQQLVPIGVEGELCIGGAGLARGYLNNAQLTAQKFIAHPYRPGERLYRTGDYGKWTPDGNISLVGRKDGQVKIRGYRVELEEIKNVILQYGTVTDVAVLAQKSDDDTQLIAYIVAGDDFNSADLRAFLSDKLPNYMIPAHAVTLPALPLTANGKLNSKALAQMSTETLRGGGTYSSPRDEVETYLADLWQEVLKTDRIGIHENFFDLGGHSLLVVKLNAKLKNRYPRVNITDLFAYPTIAQLAAFIKNEDNQLTTEVADAVVTLPADYFLTSTDEETTLYDLQFGLEAELLKEVRAIARKENGTTYDVLVAMFVYALGQISEQDRVSVQVMNNASQVNSLCIDLSEVEQTEALYRQVIQQQEAFRSVGVYTLTDVNRVRFLGRGEQTVLPFVYQRDALPMAGYSLEIFDLLLEIHEKPQRVSLSFDYNRFRLDSQKMESVFQLFLAVLQSVASYQPV